MPTGLQIRHTSVNNLQYMPGAYGEDMQEMSRPRRGDQSSIFTEVKPILPGVFYVIKSVFSLTPRSVQYKLTAVACIHQHHILNTVHRQWAVRMKRNLLKIIGNHILLLTIIIFFLVSPIGFFSNLRAKMGKLENLECGWIGMITNALFEWNEIRY